VIYLHVNKELEFWYSSGITLFRGRALPQRSGYVIDKGYCNFSGLLPILTGQSSLRRPIIVTRLATERCIYSTNSAINLEDLLIPCEYLIVLLYFDLGSTT
jgi:hypothetical protein